MHSPFGLIWLLQKETGWTDDYILWGTSYVNLQMKLSDAPHYHYGPKKNKLLKDEDELARFLENLR